MKIEQNIMTFGDLSNVSPGNNTGYIDLAQCASFANAKMIAQTKRRDGKYKPLGYMIRVRALTGSIGLDTLSCAYPTRNAVVLAGAARDAMLKSAGVSRGNLESYQKELRLKFECDQKTTNSWLPGATDLGQMDGEIDPANGAENAYGFNLTYDYNSLVYDDPAAPGTDVSQELVMVGDKNTSSDCLPVVYNWFLWRHSYTPSAAADDIADNAFSYVMQQSSTADAIIDIVEDEADEKPYNLQDFEDRTIKTVVSTAVGSPVSQLICAPLGLLKVLTGSGGATFEVEIVGVTEL